MKNRKVIISLIVLCIFLIVSFFNDNNKNQKRRVISNLPTIGVLQYVSHPALDEIYKGLIDELSNQGFKDGKSVNIVFQNGQSDQSKLTSMSQQLVNKSSDVVVGIATPAAQALANQTTEIPIVLGAISDPKSAGLVDSNEKPGRNITGVSDQAPITAQIDLIKSILPNKRRIGILYSSTESNALSQVDKVKKEAQKNNLEVKTYAVPSTNEISQTMQLMAKEIDLIYLPTDNTMANAMQMIVDIANQYNLPVIPSVDSMVEQGGLATVGVNQYNLGIQTGKMVSDLLNHKKKPEDTPIYIFDDGNTVINQKQAELLGINIPEKILKNAKIIGGEKQ